MNEESIRFDRATHVRICRTHNGTRVRVSRAPRAKRAGNLPRHGSAHRRIDFQEDALDAGRHQALQRLVGALLRGFVAERAAIGGDGEKEGGSEAANGPAKAGHYVRIVRILIIIEREECRPATRRKLHRRVAGPCQIVRNEPEHTHIISAFAATRPASRRCPAFRCAGSPSTAWVFRSGLP